MDALIGLLNDYLGDRITSEAFSLEFLHLWRMFRDDQYRVAAQKPELNKALRDLGNKRSEGKISGATYAAESHPIEDELFKGSILKRFSKEEKIVEDLFVAAERYSPPELRGPNDRYIGETELLEAAKRALADLTH